MSIALTVAQASYCKNKQVGAILVKDDNIIAIGYNGTISGYPNNCEDCNGKTYNHVLHAETNAIAKCSRSNNSSDNSVLYVTLSPCFECAKIILQSGIKKVVYLEEYRNIEGLNLLKQTINVQQFFF